MYQSVRCLESPLYAFGILNDKFLIFHTYTTAFYMYVLLLY